MSQIEKDQYDTAYMLNLKKMLQMNFMCKTEIELQM